MSYYTLDDWYRALETFGKYPRWRKNGREIRAYCPAHEGTSNDGLAVTEKDGVVLWHCYTGCDGDAVRETLGFEGRSGPPLPIMPKSRPDDEPESPDEPVALPSGHPYHPPYIYTDAAGAPILAVVRKDLRKNPKTGKTDKTFIQFTPAPGAPGLWIPHGIEVDRPLFLLSKIVAAREDQEITITEGEKCALACETAWPDQIVTCWPGGAGAWDKTNYEPLRGRSVRLLSDGDEGGRTAMRKLAYSLATEFDCSARIALTDDGDGDVADWINDDGQEAAAEKVEAILANYEPDIADKAEPPKPARQPLEGDIVSNPHYELLGLAGNAVAIRIAAAGRVLKQSRESVSQAATLISLAPLAYWYTLSGSDSLGTVTARRIGDGILRASDELGQADLVRQTGRGAVMLKEGPAFHLGDRILLDRKEYALNDGLDGRIWLAEPRVELGAEASDKDMRAIAEAMMAYRWDTEADGKRFIGWIAVALVAGALEWRPHLYLTGESTMGKSWIIKNSLQPIMGPLVHKIADATPAALARLAENASLPMVIDEAEPTNEWVVDLLKLLRVSAGSEGKRVRADAATGGVVEQLPRFAALLSSTVVPEMRRAGATRMAAVQLGDAVDDWPAVERGIRKALVKADAARFRILKRTPQIVEEAARVAKDQQAHGRDSRAAMASGALTAGWRAWGLDRSDVDSERRDPRDDVPDGVRLLFELTNLPFRLDAGKESTVLEALQLNTDPRHLADVYGIKRSVGHDKSEDGGIAIWAGHGTLRSELGRRTDKWARTNLEQSLLQIEGATLSESKTVRFGPHRKRAVLIPKTALDKWGIEIHPSADDDAHTPAEQRALPPLPQSCH